MIGMGLKPDRRATHPRMVQGVRECLEFLRQVSPIHALNYQGDIFQVHHYLPEWATAPAPVSIWPLIGPACSRWPPNLRTG